MSKLRRINTAAYLMTDHFRNRDLSIYGITKIKAATDFHRLQLWHRTSETLIRQIHNANRRQINFSWEYFSTKPQSMMLTFGSITAFARSSHSLTSLPRVS